MVDQRTPEQEMSKIRKDLADLDVDAAKQRKILADLDASMAPARARLAAIDVEKASMISRHTFLSEQLRVG